MELVLISCGHVVGTNVRFQNRPPAEAASELRLSGGRDRRRSGDLTLFRRALYQLSYPTSPRRTEVADLTGFEPATYGLTGRRALQTAPQVPNQHWRWGMLHPQRDSNPCYRLERAASWAARRWGLQPDQGFWRLAGGLQDPFGPSIRGQLRGQDLDHQVLELAE